jgi:hypothetical protein
VKAPKKPPEELLERVRQPVIAALRAEQFLAAIRTVWHDARILTDAEMAEGSQFREQLILVREANAQVYASPRRHAFANEATPTAPKFDDAVPF